MPSSRKDAKDQEAVNFVVEALEGVSQGDRTKYDSLLQIVNPHQEKGGDSETLLVAALNALSHAVFHLDPSRHSELLDIIYRMSLWNYSADTQNSIIQFIAALTIAPDKFLHSSLSMLFNNVWPPPNFRKSKRNTKKEQVHNAIHTALLKMIVLSPVALPKKLTQLIREKRIYDKSNKEEIVLFVDFLLRLEGGHLGEYLRNVLLGKILEILIDMDTNINFEDGMFDTGNVVKDETLDVAAINKKFEKEARWLKGNPFAEKLDALMVVICEQLKNHATSSHLFKLFESLLEYFQLTILKTQKPKFIQFIMFYACSLDPEVCGLRFAIQLKDTFFSKSVDPPTRGEAVLYLASYLSRAKFISLNVVADILESLVNWCYEHCESRKGQMLFHKFRADSNILFYLAMQAVMYILCFRLQSLMDTLQLRKRLLLMPLESILCNQLSPLDVCLPTIAQEFLRQANAAGIFKTSLPITPANVRREDVRPTLLQRLEDLERLDYFFPFDPYLLMESDKFMRPNYIFWSMVNNNSEDDDEEENEDSDISDLSSVNGIDMYGHHDPRLDDEGDVEDSKNKMSITPKPVSGRYFVGSNNRINPNVTNKGREHS